MTGVSSSAPVELGAVLAGKYRVERVLGEGGMGVVVAAEHLELGQRVAVKFLLPEATANAEAAARFMREARATVKIHSEHVARVIDVGRLENGAPYMVMEYLEGNDLAVEAKKGQLPIADVLDYVLQASEAIAEAHAVGIIHRDLKPANLFLTHRADKTPVVKVLDFGISKVSDMNEAALTKTAAIMGSPYYLSPEQARSARSVDVRTDIWALGVILYELIGGRTPFGGETIAELITSILINTPAPLRELRPDVSEQLEQVVMRALEKDPDQRFQNVAELATALLPFALPESRLSVDRVARVLNVPGAPDARSSIPSPVAASQGPEQVTAAKTATSWADTTPPKPRRSLTAVAVGAVLVLVAGAAVAVGLGMQSKNSDAERVPPAAAAVPAAPASAAEAAPAREPEVMPTEGTEPDVSDTSQSAEPVAAPADAVPDPRRAAPRPGEPPARAAEPKAPATPEPRPRAEAKPQPKSESKPEPAPKPNPLDMELK